MKRDLFLAGILVALAGVGVGGIVFLPNWQNDDEKPKTIKPKPEPIVLEGVDDDMVGISTSMRDQPRRSPARGCGLVATGSADHDAAPTGREICFIGQ